MQFTQWLTLFTILCFTRWNAIFCISGNNFIAGIQWKCYLLYFWQHFHLCHPVTRKSNIFLATLLPLAYAETQSIIFLATLLSLTNGENATYFWQHNFSDIWWKSDQFYFWQHFHIWYIWNCWKRDLFYFCQDFYFWHQVKTWSVFISGNIWQRGIPFLHFSSKFPQSSCTLQPTMAKENYCNYIKLVQNNQQKT